MEFIYLFKKLFYLGHRSRPQALRHIFGVALLHGDRTSPWPPSCAPVPGVEGGPRQVHWRCGAHRATALAWPCLRQPGTMSWSFIFENKQNKNNFCHTLSNAIYTHIHSFMNIREYKHVHTEVHFMTGEKKIKGNQHLEENE